MAGASVTDRRQECRLKWPVFSGAALSRCGSRRSPGSEISARLLGRLSSRMPMAATAMTNSPKEVTSRHLVSSS